ncbi:MAG TPA: nucleotidyltransferase family protein [Ignavibacteria bacterium]|nr:nucleotidyltransferase family protein [Ignavibacteria bacterium]HMR00131.1 nucleotidyltransferase family protein [Ignavibacteria bacterium]
MQNLNKENIIEFIRKNRIFLHDKYGVLSIGLMGSYARDEQTADSDIDFIVEFDEADYSNMVALAVFLEDEFGRRVDIINKRNITRKSLIRRSKTEAIYA